MRLRLQRITNATDGTFHQAYSYKDALGNFNGIFRNDLVKTNGNWALQNIDDNAYFYGNPLSSKISSILDYTGSQLGYKANSGTYAYDANGNTTYDPANKLTTLYNYLNLPSKFTKDDGKKQELVYDFSGKKWQVKEFNNSSSLLSTHSYIGSFEFEGNSLNLVHHGRGFIKNLKSAEYQTGTQNGNMQGSNIVSTQKIGEGKYVAENQICLLPGFEATAKDKFSAEIKTINPQYQWQYALSDHLGNLRVIFTDKNNDGLIRQSLDDNLNEVLSVRNYSPFGLELGGSHKNLDYQNGYKFGGKELDNFTSYSDFGGRWLDMNLSKWTTFDPLGEKFYPTTLNSYALSSPANFIDSDGKYAVSVHYQLTYDALRSRGYSHKRADLIAHYSSTYADHPEDVVRGIDHFGHNLGARSHLSYRSGINYSRTSGSQDEAFSIWHAMMSNAEADAGMTEEQAMKRGLKFGWDNVFAQKDGDYLGKLGQGIHALQDAIAHKGAKTDDHLGRNLSSVRMLINDMYVSTKEAAILTKSALVVYDLLQGRQSGLKSGDTLNFSGMSPDQLLKITQLLVNQGFQGTIKTE